jgi:hypothetical protein
MSICYKTNSQGGLEASNRVGVLLDMDKGEMHFFREQQREAACIAGKG